MIPGNGVLEFVEFCDVMAEWFNTDQNEELRLCFKVSSKKNPRNEKCSHFAIVCFAVVSKIDNKIDSDLLIGR